MIKLILLSAIMLVGLDGFALNVEAVPSQSTDASIGLACDTHVDGASCPREMGAKGPLWQNTNPPVDRDGNPVKSVK